MGLFSRNTSVSIEHVGRQTWRVRSADGEYDRTISGPRSRDGAKSQRRLIHAHEQGKTPRWARGE